VQSKPTSFLALKRIFLASFKKKSHLFLASIFFLSYSGAILNAQSGNPFIQNFPYKTYFDELKDASPQNWGIIQDERGILYFANTTGVLEFDGLNWRMIPGTRDLKIRKFAMHPTGKIFAGGNNELGHFYTDEKGRVKFNSLKPFLSTEQENFEKIRQTIAVGNSIFFISDNYLLRWSDQKFDHWKSETTFRKAFEVNGKLWIQQSKIGLFELTNEALSKIGSMNAISDMFVIGVNSLDLFSSETLFITTNRNGLFRVNNDTLEKWDINLEPLLEGARIWHTVTLNNGKTALATVGKGVIILNRMMGIERVINRKSGLHNEEVIYLYEDKENGLWLGLNNGISRIEQAHPISHYGEKLGIEGLVYSVLNNQNQTLIGASDGLYSIRQNPSFQWKQIVEKVEGINSGIWALASFQQETLVASASGVFFIKK
jgi:ligand-binding sensor domain-containing protein